MKIPDEWTVDPLMAEIKLSYSSKTTHSSRAVLNTPEAAADFIRSLFDEGAIELRVDFFAILLNTAKRCIGWTKISMGTKNAALLDIPQIIAFAILGNAASVIVSHSHPSGRLQPSQADIRITNRLASLLKFHDLELDDHIILTRDDFLFLPAGWNHHRQANIIMSQDEHFLKKVSHESLLVSKPNGSLMRVYCPVEALCNCPVGSFEPGDRE